MKNKVTKKPIRKKKAAAEKEKAVVPSPMTDPFIDSHMPKAEAEEESVPTESRPLQVEVMPDQITPGSLIAAQEVSRYQTIDENYQEIQIDQIEHFLGLPDFVARSRSKFPFIIETPLSMVCIDGWDRIQEARAEGKTRIACHVEQILEYNEKELCLRKAAVRMVAKGGRGTYGEHVRNVKILTKKLFESEEDLVSFRHGGDRRSSDFVSANRGENVREVLAHRLELSLSSIDQMMVHGQFLDDETINFFAVQGVSKTFFEKAQAVKRAQSTAMKSSRVSDEDITAQISREMLDWYREYKAEGKITPILNKTETNAETGSGRRSIPAGSLRNPRVAKSKVTQVSDTDDEFDGDIEPPEEKTEAEISNKPVFDPWRGNTEEEQEDSDSFEKVKGDVEELTQRLLAAVALDDPDLFWERIVEETTCLSRISLRAAFFRKEAQQ